jgi:GNAT superfamily N-acetyltransferase
VTRDCFGRGAGSAMMRTAMERAWRDGPQRLHLHTCTLDHPAALRFYLRWGFRPWKRAIEVSRDPRLTGDAAAGAAPDLPIL